MRSMVKKETAVDLGSDSDSDSDVDGGVGKRSRVPNGGFDEEPRPIKRVKSYDLLPLGFLDPIPPMPEAAAGLPAIEARPLTMLAPPVERACRQFWKAGEYECLPGDRLSSVSAGMDHVRVHPRFLHSNATSHKWALGAFAELLDNSLDEVCNGATFVKVNMVENKKDGSKMLLIEDNGGGMDPDKMRQCLSLGYSAKSKQRNTIGQYGNGFKTSTMRLGADVIVFSRSCGKDGGSPSQSIGMLSYTFLRATGKEDIVVPIIDYERRGQDWIMSRRSSALAWTNNLDTIICWSPYSSEVDLLQQFNMMSDQGTLIVIYNLWEDDQGEMELDFVTDKHDIQIRGANRDEVKIKLAEKCPNSRHFLTYHHSLRSYASILYLRLPPHFKMILRGKEIEHHNLVDDMMMEKQVTYKPTSNISGGVSRDQHMSAIVTVGFVKDAEEHIDIQGFNVYHKNRLIKPFWRVWNPAGSDGRGVIGVLEANFVEPAHDKQGFERTIVLIRLEARLVQMQKDFWKDNCQKIGYAPRRPRKLESMPQDRESSAVASSTRPSRKSISGSSCRLLSYRTSGNVSPDVTKLDDNHETISSLSDHDVDKFAYQHVASEKCRIPNDQADMGTLCTPLVGTKRHQPSRSEKGPTADIIGIEGSKKLENIVEPPESLLHGRSCSVNGGSYHETECAINEIPQNELDFQDYSAQKAFQKDATVPFYADSANNGNEKSNALNEREKITRGACKSNMQAEDVTSNANGPSLEKSNHRIEQLISENKALRNQIKELEQSMLRGLQYERNRNRTLDEELKEAKRNLEKLNKEQEALIDIFSEERCRRDKEEDTLRKKWMDATATIRELLENSSSTRPNI